MSEYRDKYNAQREAFKAWSKALPYQQINNIVQVVHEDGSTFIFYNAALWQSDPDLYPQHDHDQEGWIGVATEHCGDHFFTVSDLTTWRSTPQGVST